MSDFLKERRVLPYVCALGVFVDMWRSMCDLNKLMLSFTRAELVCDISRAV